MKTKLIIGFLVTTLLLLLLVPVEKEYNIKNSGLIDKIASIPPNDLVAIKVKYHPDHWGGRSNWVDLDIITNESVSGYSVNIDNDKYERFGCLEKGVFIDNTPYYYDHNKRKMIINSSLLNSEEYDDRMVHCYEIMLMEIISKF